LRLRTFIVRIAILAACLPLALAGASNPQLLYPNTPEGLKNFMVNLLQVQKHGDQQRTALELSALEIPDHKKWFADVFGSADGPRLEAKYVELLPSSTGLIQARMETCLKLGRTEVFVDTLELSVVPSMPLLQTASCAVPGIRGTTGSMCPEVEDKRKTSYLGEFVQVDGGFRYLDQQVLLALTNLPRMRVAASGSSQSSRRCGQPAIPVYPPLARQTHVQGTVVLRAIIARDGSVKELQYVSGHPLLIDSAMDAVRKWRYQPTFIDGKPVEVDTQIDVIFSLTQ
jgi:TonB family protein